MLTVNYSLNIHFFTILKIAYDYLGVDVIVVWNTIREDIPTLEKLISGIEQYRRVKDSKYSSFETMNRSSFN